MIKNYILSRGILIFVSFIVLSNVQSGEVKAEYNIWIRNLSDRAVQNLEIEYGDEIFRINNIESHEFKWRSFVKYSVPEFLVCKWNDKNGAEYNKKVAIPFYQLDINRTANLFVTIDEGFNVVIEWKSP